MEHGTAGHPGCSRSQAGRGGQCCGYFTAHRSYAHAWSQCSNASPVRNPSGGMREHGEKWQKPRSRLLLLGTAQQSWNSALGRGQVPIKLGANAAASLDPNTGPIFGAATAHSPARQHAASAARGCLRCGAAEPRMAPGPSSAGRSRGQRRPCAPLRAGLSFVPRGRRESSRPARFGPNKARPRAPPPPFVSGAAPGADKGARRDALGIKISLINPRWFAPLIVPPESAREHRGGTTRGIAGAVRGSEPSLC